MIFRPSPKGSEAPRSVAGEGRIASPDPHFHWEEALRKMSRVLGGNFAYSKYSMPAGAWPVPDSHLRSGPIL